jgi:membrane protein
MSRSSRRGLDFPLKGLSPREIAMQMWKKASENEIFMRAAAVAFYAMLASVPFLGLLLTVLVQLLPDLSGLTGRRVGTANISVEDLRRALASMFPKEAYLVIEDQIARLQEQLRTRPPIGLFAVGVATMVWLASSLYSAIIDAMNRIHGVAETRSWARIYVTAIIMTIVEAVILAAALVAIVAGPEILNRLGFRGHESVVGRLLQLVVVWLMVLTSFALSFYVAPGSQRCWRWITPGSVIGSLAFVAGSYLFRIYVQNFANYDKTYGSLGGVMMLLFWFWVSSAILLLAAQLNKVVEDAWDRCESS